MGWTGRTLVLALLVAGLSSGACPAVAEEPPPAAPPAPAPPAAAPAAPAATDPRRVRAAAGASSDLRWLLPYGARGQTLPEADRALVAGALVWLASQQRVDGGWDRGAADPADRFRPGLTALALLAILGAGHSPEGRGPYAETLRRGLGFLENLQGAEGGVGTIDANPSTSYGHAFATQALVEAAAVTGDKARIAVAQKALDAVARARNPYFAWRYGIKAGDNDTSVSGCMWAAIHAAHAANRAAAMAGVPPPFATDPEADDGMRAWVDKMTDPDFGRLGYQQRGTGPARPEDAVSLFPAELSESMTAIGVWFRLASPADPYAPPKPAAGVPVTDPAVEKGLALISKVAPGMGVKPQEVDYYFWNYASLAMSLAPPKTAADWNAGLYYALRQLAVLDDRSLHWEAPDAWSGAAGFVYCTSMATLALEARWRYRLPEASELLALAKLPTAAPETRARALGTLALLRAPRVGDLIDPALEGSDGVMRLAGAFATERTGSASAHLRALERALAGPDVVVATTAARALASAGKGRETTLAAGLAHASPAVRAAALDAVSGITSDPVVAAARAALADTDPGVRASGVEVLLAAGVDRTELLPVLAGALAAPDEPLRRRILGVLTRLGAVAAPTAPAIEALLSEGSPSVRIAASAALIATRGPSAQGLRALADALVAEDPLLREEAARLLGTMGPLAGSQAGALATAMLTDPDAVVRTTAAQALGRFGREGRDAQRALETASLDPVADVVKVAGESLAWVRDGLPADATVAPPSDAAALRAALASAERAGSVRAAVVAAATATAPWLETLAKDADVRVRIRALELLGDLAPGAKTLSPVLTEAASDPDAGVRAAALRALGRSKGAGPAVASLAATAVRDADVRVRSAALSLLCAAPSGSAETVAACATALDAVLDPAGRAAEGDAARVVDALARWKVPVADGVWRKVVAAAAGTRYPAFASRALRALPPAIPFGSPLFEDLVVTSGASHSIAFYDAANAALEASVRKAPGAGPVLVKRWLQALPAEKTGYDFSKEQRLVRMAGPSAVPPLIEIAVGSDERRAWFAANLLGDLSDSLVVHLPLVCGAVPRMASTPRYSMLWRLGSVPGVVDALVKSLRAPTPEIRTGAAMIAEDLSHAVSGTQRQALVKTLLAAQAKEKNAAVLAAQKHALIILGVR